MNRLWLGLISLPAALAVMACERDAATGPQIETQTVPLAAMNNSGITGSALIRDDEGPSSTVTVTLQGLTAGTTYIGHVHTESCAQAGGVAFTLPNITGQGYGIGSANAQVADAILTSDHYIQYHLNIPEAPEVACGDIPATGESATRSFWLVEIGSSGVTGFAVISDLAGPTAIARVDLLRGLQDGISYLGHIHVTSCASEGTVRLPLPNIVGTEGRTGSSGATEVPDSLLTVNHYFQYRLSPTGEFRIGACGDIPGAGIAPTRRVQLQGGHSGISGEAVISDTAGASSAVRLVLNGTAEGTEYPGHVHAGSCASQGGIVHTLTPVRGEVGGSGFATSRGVADSLLVTGFHFDYHDPGAAGPPDVVCGDIVGSSSQPVPPPPPDY